MTTSRPFNIIVPRIDRTGPVNVAVDIGNEAARAGYEVTLLALSGTAARDARDDLDAIQVVRRFSWRDLWRLQGVIHTHCLRPDLLGGLLSLRRGRTLISTLHNYFLLDLGFDHAPGFVQVAWVLWRIALRRYDHRVCISQAMRRHYRRLMPGQSFSACYNFRPPPPPVADRAAEVARAWEDARRREGLMVLAYVGSLSSRKNVSALLDAVAADPRMALVACGDGPLHPALQARAARPDLAGRVLLTGQLRRPDLAMEAADMLVLPSFAEGLPLVVIEALRLGKPTLLSDIAVHRELAAFGAGVTFDHRRFTDFRSQARALALSATDAATAARRKLWAECFSPAVGFARYEKLLAEGPDRPGGH